MQGKLAVGLAAAAAFLAMTGTAQAGYAHLEVSNGTIGDVITRFNAGPGEKPDLRIQVVDSETVVFEDLANPITAGPPPGGLDTNVDPVGEFGDLAGGRAPVYLNAQPCEVISTHKARCSVPGRVLQEMVIDTGPLAAKVRDLPGGFDRPIELFTGRLNDDVELLHHEAAFVRDSGGNNKIHLGAGSGGLWEPTNSIIVGPGGSVINVRNGAGGDVVRCWSVESATLGLAPTDYAISGHVFADATDDIHGCKNVQRG